MDNLTIKEAYQVMLLYLENLYELTDSDDLAGFLGSMQFLEDGSTADSAAWEDWLDSVKKLKDS